MAQTKILVDSSSYFRLAQNIHPLLFVPFGAEGYTLYAHEALAKEFERQPRLQNKFHWFLEQRYAENRRRPLTISRKQRASIEDTFEHIWAHVQDEALGTSRVDTWILATACELEIRMVADDANLQQLAQMYCVHWMTSLELMQLMLAEKRIDMDKVRQIGSQWACDQDLPGNFHADYLRLFGEEPRTD